MFSFPQLNRDTERLLFINFCVTVIFIIPETTKYLVCQTLLRDTDPLDKFEVKKFCCEVKNIIRKLKSVTDVLIATNLFDPSVLCCCDMIVRC